MAPQFTKPCDKTNKGDTAIAEPICEAVARYSMRLDPIKNFERKAALAMRRARQGMAKALL